MQRDTFASMISQLQKATRTLQILSCEGKKHKDASVVSRIPLLKRTMERFIFRMKAFFHGTDLVDKFWMGNLKHKVLPCSSCSERPVAMELNPANCFAPAESPGGGGLLASRGCRGQ